MNRKMKWNVLASGVAVLILAACSNSKHDGFELSDTGLHYVLHKHDESARKPSTGNILFCNMKLLLKGRNGKQDSMMYNSNEGPDFGQDIKFVELMAPKHKGDLMEGLSMLHLGDSASFIVSADSFFLVANQMKELPPGIKKGDELLFHFVLRDFKSLEDTKALLENYQAKMSAGQKAEMDELRETESQRMAEYLERKGIKEKPTASGLIYVEQEKGKGPKPKKGQTVTLQYTGYLLNGKKFDSSFDHGAPFSFTLGKGEVIAGWDEGVSMMNVGTSATFVIPSVLAYGSNGTGGIPPFSPLVFEVQLMKAE